MNGSNMAREKRDAVTSIRLFPSMKARIEEQANKHGVKFSEWVEEALERSLRAAEDTYPEDDIVNFDYMEGMTPEQKREELRQEIARMVAKEFDARFNSDKNKEKFSPQEDFFKKPGI